LEYKRPGEVDRLLSSFLKRFQTTVIVDILRIYIYRFIELRVDRGDGGVLGTGNSDSNSSSSP
jgi:hypothetical protein